MKTNDKKSDSELDVLGKLIDLGRILAKGAAKHPFIAGIVFCILIVTVAMLYLALIGSFQSQNVVYIFFGFLLVVLVAMFLIFKMEVKTQRKQIQHYAEMEVEVGNDTMLLVDELKDLQKQYVLRAVCGAAEDVADVLEIPHNFVRSNLFGVDSDNRMRMIREFTYNMNRDPELTITMPVGYGSTGRCFQSGKPNIAVFREGWGEDTIDDEELRKVHPDLQWIISVPVLVGGGKVRPIWVLNVDGLRERMGESDLKRALSHLFSWSQIISLIIARKYSE